MAKKKYYDALIECDTGEKFQEGDTVTIYDVPPRTSDRLIGKKGQVVRIEEFDSDDLPLRVKPDGFRDLVVKLSPHHVRVIG